MTGILAHATVSNTAESNAGSKKGPPPTIGVRVLLVSGDIQVIDTLCESMGKMSMHVDICSNFASAADKLCHSKFEALVVDFKDRDPNMNPIEQQAMWRVVEQFETTP